MNHKNCNRCGKFRSLTRHTCLPVKVMKNGKVDWTFISSNPNVSTKRSVTKKRTTKKKSRFISGAAVGIVSLIATFTALTSFANFQIPSSEVTYQQTAQSISTSTPTLAPKTKVESVESIKEKILRYSLKYDVDHRELENIVRCETGSEDVNKASTTIRSRYLEGTPRHERSWGLAQIWLTGHPDISYEQAIDPDFAIDFLAKNWKQHKEWWMCAKKLGL